jgi:hypothetical protein
MKTKVLLAFGIVAVVLALNLSAIAGSTDPVNEEVVYLGVTYCVNMPLCTIPVPWGGTAGGYVEFLGPNGQPSEYIWTNAQAPGLLTFESEPLNELPPSYDPLLGVLNEGPGLQQVNQFFPGAVDRPLFVLSNEPTTTPEPSTLLLFGSAGVMLFARRSRFWGS